MSRSVEELLAQWDRTVRVYGGLWELEGGYLRDWQLGVAVVSTRLFLAGDHLLVTMMNGGGQRQPVYAVTGKGIHLVRYFLNYRTSGVQRDRRIPIDRRYVWDRHRRLKGGETTVWYDRDHGPMRFVECPDEMAGLPPSDPAVRRFVEVRVRASAVGGVSTNIPALSSDRQIE
jgi:hypothetical protein